MFRRKRPDANLQCARVVLYAFFISAAVLLVVFYPSYTPLQSSGKVVLKKSKAPTQVQQDVTADNQQAAKQPAGPAAAGGAAAAAGSAAAGGTPPDMKVKIELFVMSNCPDARFCIEEFDKVTEKLQELVAIRTEYIATVDEGAKGVSCMHGDDECAGNMQQLCLQQHTPPEKTMALFFPSLVCHMAASPGSDIKPLTQCMTSSAVPDSIQGKVAACASGAEGTKLAIQSAKVVEERQVVKSCTVFIGGQKRCIRDGGSWYDCKGGHSTADFIKTICDAYTAQGSNAHPACAAVKQ